MSPVYWKRSYPSRTQLHRAWVRRQAERESALRRASGPSLLERLRRLLTRRG